MPHFLCNVSDLPENTSLGFEVANMQLFAIHKDAQYYVYKNACPHLNIPLEWQPHDFLDSEKALIQCSTHGALFLIENGECIAGPCQGDKLIPIEFFIQNEQIMVTI